MINFLISKDSEGTNRLRQKQPSSEKIDSICDSTKTKDGPNLGKEIKEDVDALDDAIIKDTVLNSAAGSKSPRLKKSSEISTRSEDSIEENSLKILEDKFTHKKSKCSDDTDVSMTID